MAGSTSARALPAAPSDVRTRVTKPAWWWSGRAAGTVAGYNVYAGAEAMQR